MSDMVDSLKRRLRAVSRSIFRKEKIFIFERPLADACFKIEAKVEVNVRLFQRDNFPKIAELFEKFKIKAKKRFKMGHICFIADLHGDIVHLVWAAFNEAYAGELERKLRISSDSAYLYDGYTFQSTGG